MACVHHCCPKAACSASRRFPLAAAGSELGLPWLCSGGHGERAIGGWTTPTGLPPLGAGLPCVPAVQGLILPSVHLFLWRNVTRSPRIRHYGWCHGSVALVHTIFPSVVWTGVYKEGSPGDLYPAPSPWVALGGLLLRRRLSSTASDFNIKSHFKFFVVFSPFVLCLNKRCEFIHCKNICVTVG